MEPTLGPVEDMLLTLVGLGAKKAVPGLIADNDKGPKAIAAVRWAANRIQNGPPFIKPHLGRLVKVLRRQNFLRQGEDSQDSAVVMTALFRFAPEAAQPEPEPEPVVAAPDTFPAPQPDLQPNPAEPEACGMQSAPTGVGQ